MNAAPKLMQPDFAAMRLNMIEGQLRPNGIRDERILGVMECLPRERFAPPNVTGICCIDEELPVSQGRAILRPLVQARLVQAANVIPTDKVLVIGAATGYGAVILGVMAQKVIALESVANLGRVAAANAAAFAHGNVHVVSGVLRNGWQDEAPYNAIIIEGAVEVMPEELLTQLAEGGRLATVVRHYGAAHASHVGAITLYEKLRGVVSSRVLMDASASLLVEFAKPKNFKEQVNYFVQYK